MNDSQEQNNNLIPRPPIVVVLGHVDHGKTSLLDYIRKTKVAEQEAGGITQDIGAYEVEIQPKKTDASQTNFATESHKITFIDTPGHEAFSKMRARGAQVADLALLVIAADEGVKPQTKESLTCIQEAKIPFIVVLTKIDKEGANVEKVKTQLAELGVYLEGWGGEVPLVAVSVKTGQGIEELLELILLVSEMEGLKADPLAPASGVVIESHLDSKRGVATTLIITNGILHLQDKVKAGMIQGKVKILEDFQGKSIKEATFSSPVRVIGFEALPPIGEKFEVITEGKNIKEPVEDSHFASKKELGNSEAQLVLPVIIKTDTVGSGEALEPLLDELGKEENWKFEILINEAGDLSEGDLKIISQEPTLVILFRVNKKPEVDNFLLAHKNINLIEGNIIYELKDKIVFQVKNKIISKPTEEIIGKLEVLALFHPIKGKQLIGGKVIEGIAKNKIRARVYRGTELLGEAKILNLQKERRDTEEVKAPNEVGLLVDFAQPLVKGDLLEFFQKI